MSPEITPIFYQQLGLTEEHAEELRLSDPHYLQIIGIAVLGGMTYADAAQYLARQTLPAQSAQRPSNTVDLHNPNPSFAKDRKIFKSAVAHARQHNT